MGLRERTSHKMRERMLGYDLFTVANEVEKCVGQAIEKLEERERSKRQFACRKQKILAAHNLIVEKEDAMEVVVLKLDLCQKKFD